MLSIIPILETEHLRLRAHQKEDLKACSAVWGDPEVCRYIGGKTFTEHQVWLRILTYAGHWSVMGYGYWAVVDRVSGLYLGDVGLTDYKREIQAPIQGSPEAGWVLAPSAQGRGLATEAMRAVIDWGDANLAGKKMVALIHPENLASARIAVKLGFREFLRTEYLGGPAAIYGRDPIR